MLSTRYINIKNTALGLLAGAMFAGCYRDLGNYEYKDVNQIKVDTLLGVKDVYQYDTLRVTPYFSATQDTTVLQQKDRYTYEWFATTPSSSYFRLDTTRILNVRINLTVGSYKLIFRMKDKVGGNIYTFSQGGLNVVSGTYEGWLVFSDVNGAARLDMVNFLTNKAPAVTKDILQASPDLPKKLTGPKDVAYMYSSTNGNTVPAPGHGTTTAADKEWIYICTDQGAWKLRNDDLTTKWQWNTAHEFTSKDSATFHPDFVGSGGSGIHPQYIYLFDGQGNVYERFNYMFYGNPVNVVSGEAKRFKAAPFIGRHFKMNTSAALVLFDTEKRRFLRYSPNGGQCASPTSDPAFMPYFNYNNVNMDLVWMRSTPFNTLTYAVLKAADNSRWLAVFDISTTNVQNKFVKLTGPDIDKATRFAVDKNSGTLFYSVGSKVYATSKDYPDQTYMVLDAGQEEVTLLDQHVFWSSKYMDVSPTNRGNLIMIGTYNAATGNGTLTGYYPADFVNSHAAFTKVESFTGFGKINALSYRERF